MSSADDITAELVALVDERLGKVTDELASMVIRLEDLKATEAGLNSVRARLLGEAASVAPELELTEQMADCGPIGEGLKRVGEAIQSAAERLGGELAKALPAPGDEEPDTHTGPQPLEGGLWSPDEDQAVRDLWLNHRDDCYAELPHRTVAAVNMRAYKLGIRAGDRGRPTAAVQPFPMRNPPAPPAEPEHSDEFKAQLDRVANGARLIETPAFSRAAPAMTLGGVTGEIV